MSNLVQLIKQASMEANEAAVPIGIVFGTVVSSAPLKVQIDQKIMLDDDFLIVPEGLADHAVSMTVSHSTELAGARSHVHTVSGVTSSLDSEQDHSHGYFGTKNFTVLAGLKTGEKVILLRMQGGQKYLVLDRMVSG